MALPWPISAPTLPRPASARAASADRAATTAGARTETASASRGFVHLVTSPVSALVAMLLGLVLLFALPLVGLPFVALVVFPATVYHLRGDSRARYRRRG